MTWLKRATGKCPVQGGELNSAGLGVDEAKTKKKGGKATAKVKRKGRRGSKKGAESWRRYMQYITEQGLVVDLHIGDRLSKVLYGNLKEAERRIAEDANARVVHSIGTPTTKVAVAGRRS